MRSLNAGLMHDGPTKCIVERAGTIGKEAPMEIGNSMVSAASTAAGAASMAGISVLNKAMDAQASQNAQLLASIPQAPRPGGNFIDLYV